MPWKPRVNMPDSDDIIDLWRVPHGKAIKLKDYDPAWSGDPKLPKAERKQFAEEVLTQDVSALAEAQDRLYAANSWSILIVLQAMDAAGKDGTIKHVMSGVNPQGCQVHSFKHPLGRGARPQLPLALRQGPARARPHRHLQPLVLRGSARRPRPSRAGQAPSASPTPRLDDDFWADRYADINAFERHLTRNGTVILKFFLHLSKDEQRKRFLKRLKDPDEAVEVLGRRPRRTSLLGRLHEGLRGSHQRDQHQDGPPGTSSRPTTSGSAGPSSPRIVTTAIEVARPPCTRR